QCSVTTKGILYARFNQHATMPAFIGTCTCTTSGFPFREIYCCTCFLKSKIYLIKENSLPARKLLFNLYNTMVSDRFPFVVAEISTGLFNTLFLSGSKCSTSTLQKRATALA